MATLLSRATGNWSSASTWSLVDSTSLSASEFASNFATLTYVSSSTFTPGAITIDAIAVKMANRAQTPTGTMSVALDQATTTVTGTEVTINVADLPASAPATNDAVWIVFKFVAPVLLVAATAYSVKVKTSSNSQVILYSLATTNWSRMLRTTTTQAPVAGDDVHVAGEYTGAGTSNTLTVTMNNTAATDYGSAPSAANSLITPGVGISSKGVLTFDSGSAVNPLLRLSNSLIVYNGGILNMGTTGTPIPRDSRAILEFDQLSADGDYGLIVRNGGTLSGQGLSRTSGKNVVSCEMTANAPTATNLISGVSGTVTGSTVVSSAALGPSGVTREASGVTDSASGAVHLVAWTGTTLSNTTQVASIWVARGTGTNNRYCRILLGNSSSTPTNGFYVDTDLQAGTVGTVTALGNGTATSVAITAVGTGYVITIIGKVSSGSATSNLLLYCCNASGGTSYTGDTTQCLLAYGQQVFTNASLPSADLTVDTDTGWLSGDMIAVASTTRTAGDCEALVLSGNAGASTLTSTEVITNNHSGTSPTQAEVILLTRNVVVRSTSSLLMAYVNVQAGGIADLDWVQFYYLGEGATNKRGIEVGSSTTLTVNFNMQYCSVHDCEDNGIYLLQTTAICLITTCVFSYNMMWNMATVTGPAVQMALAITPTNWTMDHNILIRTGNNNGFTLNDVGGTFTNNTVVGTAATCISLAESAGLIGTFSGNVVHSSANIGVTLAASVTGVIGSLTGWRNTGSALTISVAVMDVTISDLVCFGNQTTNLSFTSGANGMGMVTLDGIISSGDTTFSTTSGILMSGTGAMLIVIDDSDFGTVSGIKTAHTQDINIAGAAQHQLLLRNTKLASSVEVATASNLTERGYISSQKHDQTAGNHVTWMKHGKVATDAAIYHTAAPSMRMSPTMAAHFVTATITTTQGNVTITAVPSYFFDWVAIGDWVTVSTDLSLGARVTAVNAGAGTITLDRSPTGSGTGRTLTFFRGKLPSAPPGRGFKIAVDDGETRDVGVWVRKQQENLFTYSEDFSNATAWTLTNATATTGQTDPLGGTAATKFLETTANGAHILNRGGAAAISIAAGATYTISVYAKPVGRQWFYITEGGRNTWIDLTNGVAGTTNAAHTVVVTADVNGFYRIKITVVATSTTSVPTFSSATADNNSSSFVGDVTKGFILWGWQYEQNSTASPYQVTTSALISGFNGYGQPRLIQRANAALGIASDVVIDTASAVNGEWEQLGGTTTAPTGDAGVIELYVDCDGMVGFINVDDFSVT